MAAAERVEFAVVEASRGMTVARIVRLAFVGLAAFLGLAGELAHGQDPGTTISADSDDLGLPRGNFGDLNGDGRADVLLRRTLQVLEDVPVDGRWLYYPMDGARQAAGRGGATLTRDLNWRFAATGDMDGDGKDDVLMRRRDGIWRYYPMDGRRSLPGSGAVAITVDPHWRFAGTGDLNGDGNMDVVLRHTDGRWTYYALSGRESLPASGELRLPDDADWRYAGIGDLNADGKDDVLLRHTDGRWRYFAMDGRQVVSGSGYANLTRNLLWALAGIGDLDGDGADDVLLRHEDGRWFYYPMAGRQHVMAGRGFAGLTRDLNWRIAGLGDFNGDGRDDVLLRHADGRWHYYAMDGRQPLEEAAANLTPRLDWQGVFANDASESSTSGWLEGVFADAAGFKNQCVEPRSGADLEGNPFPDRPGSVLDENNYLRSWSNDTYLWYDEIVDEDPGCCETWEYFSRLMTFARTPSGRLKDEFHFTEPTEERQRRIREGVSAGYGARFVVLSSRPPRLVRVAFVEPNSPAATGNLARGATIVSVDDAAIADGDPDVLNAGLFPRVAGEQHTFVVRDLNATEDRTVELEAAQITSAPVQRTNVIETDTGRVGYFVFNSHISTAEAGLIEAVTRLAGEDIDDLIVDLRYNGGGYLDIASQLGYMVAGRNASGRVFSELQFNDKHRYINPVTGRALTPRHFHEQTLNFSRPAGTPLPTLHLNRVTIIAGERTCSASEAFLNSLRGIGVEVTLIGSKTCGKPYGFYPVDNCGTTYSSVQFRSVNAVGFGDYSEGFAPMNIADASGVPVPGCSVADDFDHAFGDENEARLAAALQYRQDGTCPVPPAAIRPFWTRRGTGGPIADPSPALRGEAILLLDGP